ncbi:hypothetical protein L226DRAFT_550932 [Lentinus tigrinus ALCF2SS1-7]|uniref:Uncharacterized protein n=1 Tax=Lentinus tigrinus ALCF2SS1-6 TaxID=1328759 RepID=A0A5C2RZI8_9APHY|nr:hypothetical protein L227DRAFT_531642 [Lentinus tigrinus ALCF2SS1-6]RPD79606.1 hypothetical protein L226DRAFT_550932 [Lentinus tigrinus ALCF2SS1-7]
MRNTLPLLSRAPAPNSSFSRAPSPLQFSDTPSHPVPTIRLISATPSAAGSAGDASTSFASSSFASVAPFASSPLAPKPEVEAPRKRLVPKKSKLGLLTSSKTKEKVNKDFSDVVRRVGGAPSTGRSGFEIYVDQTEDPDMGEIVVVKKKKSRLGLDGMKWGALGEVTNIPSASQEQPKSAPADNLLKVKGDENQKWWSIGRGRKDSKGKDKEQKAPARSKTPEPAKPFEGRARFNSLDSGILLNSPAAQPQKQGTVSSVKTLLEVPVVNTTPATDNGENAPISTGLLSADAPPTGSIAVRAIRSMRSLARMASWAQLSNDKEGNTGPAATETLKTKTKEEKKMKEKDEKKTKEKGEMKKKKKKEKEKPKEKESKEKESREKEKEKTIRYSGSSFEAGALSTQGSPAPLKTEDGSRTLTRKKQSVLGLGLPSSMRLSTVRDVSGSSAGSSTGIPQAPQRLSVDSAHLIMNAQGRPSSILSSGSSLRPPSTASGISTYSGGRSPRSSSSSVVSVRWDEAGLKSVKERQRQERRSRRETQEKDGSKTKRESRRSSDSRRRTPISEIFPETQMQDQQRNSTASLSPPASIVEHPLVRVEEATADGHSAPTDDERERSPPKEMNMDETPNKRARPRPMSEQMLGRPRPQAICENSEGDAMLSLLDAATNDLASLINRLDLEATPGSTNNTPLRLSPGQPGEESPLKARAMRYSSPLKGQLRESAASIASLRPYAKSQSSAVHPKLTAKTSQTLSKAAELVGQQIAPWNELDWKVSPRKPLVKPKPASHLKHKRTLTPSPADPPPVFQPLRPANTRSKASLLASSPASRSATPPVTTEVSAPSSRTFGSRPSKVGLKLSNDDEDVSHPSPTPVFSRVGGHARKGSQLVPMNSKGSMGSLRRMGVPMTTEARKGLGLCGTLGGSTEPDVDPEDPDSDIPDELQVILSGQSDEEFTRPLTPFDDTLSFRPPPSPGSPPNAALPVPEPEEEHAEDEAEVPVFHAQLFDTEANQAELDDGEHTGPNTLSEDDTKRSFDFTGELRKLNESGGSDRASFVEQLETAFKTPARVQLDFDFGVADNLAVPPVPALPKNLRPAPAEDVPQSFSNMEETTSMYDGSDETGESGNRDSGYSQVQSQDISLMIRELEDECRVYPPMSRASSSSMQSKPSDGHLRRDFKFGGKPSPQGSMMSSTNSDSKPLTLSDIIPPLTHSRSQSHSSIVEEDSSVLKSIMAKATEIVPEDAESRSRVNSSASSKHGGVVTSMLADETAGTQGHSRGESVVSFTGFDSFDEVRRGFEFGPNRPAFYPPANAVFRPAHNRDMSLFSIASVSSYGAVVNSGTQDPFGYAHDGPSRPPSMDDMSISMSMSVDDTFSFIRNKPRSRVDSDASSFYFQMHPYRRGHRRGPSNMSVASNAPPISLYNRSFGARAHRRNDSNTSASSVALSYAMHGAGGGRSAWPRHNRDFSVDSIMSEDYSERPMARPGLGDKMFDNAHGAPLSAISASPESTYSEPEEVNRTSWDSIMDNTGRYTSVVDDSIFDKTGKRTSVSSESIFGCDPSYAQYGRYMPSQQFRPLSIMSEMSVHSPVKEDDTMITMLGGGHVRRRSISSLVEASPCVRMERIRHAALPGRVLQFEAEPPLKESPKEPRLLAQPSIASTSSVQFGGERMIKARQGLLERQSLEDSALMAQGEDLLASLRERSIFARPSPAGRSRSSTCTSASSGTDTPPLSASDGSVSGGSQSSIDLGRLSTLLANATQPTSGLARARSRARARGTGHRRRIDEARMSRSSVYETIEEEASVYSSSPSSHHPTPQSVAKSSMMNDTSIFVVESDRDSVCSVEWDDEHGITTLRRYYALRDEAQVTVDESKRAWADTPFSVFALQTFQPPREPVAMQAMLEHSQNTFGPLPSELRPHRVRSRTSSRPSPYPLRAMRSTVSPEKQRGSPMQVFSDAPSKPFASAVHEPSVLREVWNANVNVPTPPPALGEIKPFSPFHVELETSKQGKNAIGLPARPRVTSSTRRAALGWSKRSTGKSSTKSSTQDYKENSVIIPTPSETLRINRPRPRGRPTPARVAVPAA